MRLMPVFVAEKIKKKIMIQPYISGIKEILAGDIKVQRKEHSFFIEAPYQVMRHIVSNASILF